MLIPSASLLGLSKFTLFSNKHTYLVHHQIMMMILTKNLLQAFLFSFKLCYFYVHVLPPITYSYYYYFHSNHFPDRLFYDDVCDDDAYDDDGDDVYGLSLSFLSFFMIFLLNRHYYKFIFDLFQMVPSYLIYFYEEYCFSLRNHILLIIITFVGWFVIGAVIGWIVGNVKEKSVKRRSKKQF